MFRFAAPRVVGRAAVLVLVVTLGACRDKPTAPAPIPTRSQAGALAGDGGGIAPAGAASDAIPTWTLPPGALAGTPAPPAPGAGTAVGGAVGPTPVPPVGAIPEATARPAVVVGDGGPPTTDPEIDALIARVDAARLSSDVRQLVAFGTRHVFSTGPLPTHGVLAAADWLSAAFGALDGRGGRQVLVENDAFELETAGRRSAQRNIVATLPGLGHAKRLVYVTAHYDSRTADLGDSTSDAPGADDNASGVAALLELARVMSERQWDATVRFLATSAAETGLQGARHHAGAARTLGLPIVAVLNNDIVGGARGPDGTSDPSRVRVFSDGPDDGPSRRLARYVQVVGSRYGLLSAEVVPQGDRPGRAGDHQAFSDSGFAAVRLIEGLEDPTRQHNARDTMDRLDASYHAAVVKLDLAVIANLALAPPAPAEAPRLSVSPSRPDAVRVAWTAVADPAVAGYFVAVRGTGEATYRQVVWAGDGTDFVLPGLSPDESVAVAVASSDDRGHISPFSPEVVR